MNILGISCFYHDAAASILKDGILVAAVEEERFTRKKHDSDFPINAIKYCLKEANISIDEVDYVGFYEKPFVKFERILHMYISTFPKSFVPFVKIIPSWLGMKLRLPSLIRNKLKYNGKMLFVEHHQSHAASAFLPSPFKKAAILTVDGVGEWTTMTYGIGKRNDMKLIKEIQFPHSLGLLYSAVTTHLGFRPNNDEYKVMGLAAYGRPVYYDKLKKVIDIKDDGSFKLNMDYFAYHYAFKMLSKKFEKEFGPPRKCETRILKKHKDIAASLQKLTEDILLKAVKNLYKITKMDNLCIAGGVGLNSVANGRILRESPFKNIFFQPAASDAGGSIGAAMYIYNVLLKNKRKYIMKDVYLGPDYSENEIKNVLDDKNIKYEKLEQNTLLKKVAKLIYENKIIGWYQGKMEFGPRALGSRSILANPCNPEMKDVLNKKVKHREPFRPFAASVLLEDIKKYFNMDKPSPFMLVVCNVKKSKQKILPAVTHVDGTVRLQTVTKKENKLFYNLIKEFKKLSGVGTILNTSFNVRGEPIVCSPEQAYNCFDGTQIDYLIMDKFLIKK